MGRPDTADPQFRILQGVHETFAGSLATSLATFLQSEILASLREICFVTAADFQSALPAPSCLIALRLHPRQERTILYFPSPTVFALLDLLLGGRGGPGPTPERGLTEIEWSLLEEVVRVIVRCLGEAWQCFHAVEFEVESLGSDPSLLPSPDPTRSVVRIGFDLQLGGQAASFDIVVPRIFFETTGPGQELEGVESRSGCYVRLFSEQAAHGPGQRLCGHHGSHRQRGAKKSVSGRGASLTACGGRPFSNSSQPPSHRAR
jgi:flagellar motor switch protein FliM